MAEVILSTFQRRLVNLIRVHHLRENNFSPLLRPLYSVLLYLHREGFVSRDFLLNEFLKISHFALIMVSYAMPQVLN